MSDGESAVSRPSLTNCADSDFVDKRGSTADTGNGGNGGDSETGGDSAEDSERNIPAAIEGIVRELRDERQTLALRALSVVPDHRLRKEATREIRGGDGSYKAKSVSGVLKAFLRWVHETEETGIVFEDPDGEEVTANLPHSYDEEYVAEKYGVIKDAERAFVRDAEDPHTAMLTLTGSNLNASGKPRCPGDFLVDLKDSWRDYVRRELQRTMDGLGFDRYDPEDPPERWWEYAVVVEPHKSGYPHMHVAVFASHPVERHDFKPVMDKHVEKCDMAGSDAHAVSADDTAVSVNAVDPDTEYDPESDELQDISNLGSYLAEYIGGGDGEIWDRPLAELVTFSLLWATETRRVQFSQGFHRLADEGLQMRDGDPDRSAEDWDLVGMEDKEGTVHEIHRAEVCKDCGRSFKDFPWPKCPECMGPLISKSADYMREIRGVPGGDTPPVRD